MRRERVLFWSVCGVISGLLCTYQREMEGNFSGPLLIDGAPAGQVDIAYSMDSSSYHMYLVKVLRASLSLSLSWSMFTSAVAHAPTSSQTSQDRERPLRFLSSEGERICHAILFWLGKSFIENICEEWCCLTALILLDNSPPPIWGPFGYSRTDGFGSLRLALSPLQPLLIRLQPSSCFSKDSFSFLSLISCPSSSFQT